MTSGPGEIRPRRAFQTSTYACSSFYFKGLTFLGGESRAAAPYNRGMKKMPNARSRRTPSSGSEVKKLRIENKKLRIENKKLRDSYETIQSKNRLDRIAKRLFGFFASSGCRTEFCSRPGYRVLDVSHRNQDGLLHVYYGCFPKDCPDAECMREVVRNLAHIPSGQFKGRPVMAFGFLDLGGISSLEELEIRLAVMGA